MKLAQWWKNWPLSRQILVLFMLLTTILGTSVGVLYPFAVKQYLVGNTYALLEAEFAALSERIAFTEQRELLPVPVPAPFFLQLLLSNYEYSFDMIVFAANGRRLGYRMTEAVPLADQAELFRLAAASPDEELRRGTLSRGTETYLFVSKRMDYRGFPYYLVIFSKERELNQINAILTRQFILIFAVLLSISWLLAVWFSRYVTQPLRKLEESCQRLARRQFDIPLAVDREDEIGQLARSFASMMQQLKEYDESQRRLVQNISHELKTPIMAIQGYAQALREGVFEGPQAEKGLSVILDESKRLEKVVEQLLYLTKIESVSRVIDTAPVDLTEMLGDLKQRLHVLNPQVAWEMELPPALTAEGDREQLNTALRNILENQLRYAASRLVIRGEARDGQVQLTLANDGPPIDEALLPHLFQRFRKGKGGKHGLGLAIARAVVEMHGGTITAANAPPGVVFTVTLPALPGGTQRRPRETSEPGN